MPALFRHCTFAVLALGVLSACTTAPVLNPPPQSENKHPASAPLVFAETTLPWGATLRKHESGTVVAAALHDKGSVGFWRIGRDRQLEVLNPGFEVGFHPDSVAPWGSNGYVVAVEGAGKLRFLTLEGKQVRSEHELRTPFPTRDLVAADLDQDGKMDLVLTPYEGKRVAILWGEGGYAFSSPQFLAAALTPWHVRARDWNGDGRADLIWSDWDTGSVRLYENAGGRSFELRLLQGAGPGRPRNAGVGDVDGDGQPDVLLPQEVGKSARLLKNRGRAEVAVEEVPAPDWGYVSAEVMKDGTLVLGEEGRVLLARRAPGGQGGWVWRSLKAASLPGALLLDDLDQDGVEDLLITNSAGGGLMVHFGPLWDKADPMQMDVKR